MILPFSEAVRPISGFSKTRYFFRTETQIKANKQISTRCNIVSNITKSLLFSMLPILYLSANKLKKFKGKRKKFLFNFHLNWRWINLQSSLKA